MMVIMRGWMVLFFSTHLSLATSTSTSSKRAATTSRPPSTSSSSTGSYSPVLIQPKCATNPIASNTSWVPSHVNHITAPSPPPLPPVISPLLPPVAGEEAKESLKEMIATTYDDGENEEKVSVALAKSLSSFWRFERSTSLNVSGSNGNGSHRIDFICYLTLVPISKSVGSNPNPTPKQQCQSSLRKSTSSNSNKRKPKRDIVEVLDGEVLLGDGRVLDG